MTSNAVRMAGAGPDLNHRDPEYLDLVREVKAGLLAVYGQAANQWRPYLLGGSGTLAVEAMVTSLVKDGPVLILENGYYSSRIREIFEIHKIPFKALTFGWLDPWDLGLVDAELQTGYEAVIGVHNETTTGRLNDVTALGVLCKRHSVRCLIDAMSSFGADPLDFAGIDAVCASGNKCLHSIPGVGFVLVGSELAALMPKYPRRSYYMSLPMYEGDSPPLTPPVPALAALRQALREYPAGGVSERRKHYLELANYLRRELIARDFRCPIDIRDLSCTLSTFSLPSGLSYDRWFELNFEQGFVIYACKGDLRERYFQVSNMGELTLDDVHAWITAVDQILPVR
jgi:2-aminoethylphosphonate-pyruvate transaminase